MNFNNFTIKAQEAVHRLSAIQKSSSLSYYYIFYFTTGIVFIQQFSIKYSDFSMG